LEAFAFPVLEAEARLSSAVMRRSSWSTRFIADPFSPRARVDLLCTLLRKVGFSADDVPAEADRLPDAADELFLALAEPDAFARVELLELSI
jgi:hypothetical protein